MLVSRSHGDGDGAYSALYTMETIFVWFGFQETQMLYAASQNATKVLHFRWKRHAVAELDSFYNGKPEGGQAYIRGAPTTISADPQLIGLRSPM